MPNMFTAEIRTNQAAQAQAHGWAAALRSGDYVQGLGVLRISTSGGNPDTYCCLGVLCDRHDNSRWILYDNGSFGYESLDSGIYYTVLPPDISQALCLEDSDGNYTGDDGQIHNLIEHNDSMVTNSLSFDGIADLIEKELALAIS